MAIHRKRNDGKPVPQPDFAYYPTDALAGIVGKAWTDQDFQDLLLERHGTKVTDAAADTARNALADAGYFLTRAVVITEDEYDNDYQAQQHDEVVFVLPNAGRVPSGLGSKKLLETAKLLMAATPNGI